MKQETKKFLYGFLIGIILALIFILITVIWLPLIIPLTFFTTIGFLIGIIQLIRKIISKDTNDKKKSIFALSLGLFLTYTSIISLIVGIDIVLEIIQVVFYTIIGIIIFGILTMFFRGTKSSGGSENSKYMNSSRTDYEEWERKYENQMIGKEMQNRHREEQERIKRQKDSEF